jgi:GAG-pre-integrase domain
VNAINANDENLFAIAMSANHCSDKDKKPNEVKRSTLSISREDRTHVMHRTEGAEQSVEHAPITEQVHEQETLREKPIMIDFHDSTEKKDEQVKDEFASLDSKSLKLLWHYRLGHLPFSTIKRRAKRGELPKKLANCPDPLCTSCIYGQMTQRAWRTRGDPANIGQQRSITQPGDCVSIDQLESPVLGFIAQIKGTPQKARYNSWTIFIDHYIVMQLTSICRSQPMHKKP